jgi:hypothetical protein
MDNFYCQQKCGEVDFSIDEWNKAFKYCIDNNLSEEEINKILDGEPCENQCFDCMAIVGERKKKNRLVRESKAQNEA